MHSLRWGVICSADGVDGAERGKRTQNPRGLGWLGWQQACLWRAAAPPRLFSAAPLLPRPGACHGKRCERAAPLRAAARVCCGCCCCCCCCCGGLCSAAGYEDDDAEQRKFQTSRALLRLGLYLGQVAEQQVPLVSVRLPRAGGAAADGAAAGCAVLRAGLLRAGRPHLLRVGERVGSGEEDAHTGSAVGGRRLPWQLKKTASCTADVKLCLALPASQAAGNASKRRCHHNGVRVEVASAKAPPHGTAAVARRARTAHRPLLTTSTASGTHALCMAHAAAGHKGHQKERHSSSKCSPHRGPAWCLQGAFRSYTWG